MLRQQAIDEAEQMKNKVRQTPVFESCCAWCWPDAMHFVHIVVEGRGGELEACSTFFAQHLLRLNAVDHSNGKAEPSL